MKRGIKKKKSGRFKEFLSRIFVLWAYHVFVKKRLSKIKYGAEDSISNVDLDLFFRQTTNYCCFGNSERSAVNNALISTSLFSTSGEIILVSCVIIYKYFRPIIPFLFFSVGQQDFLCGTFVLPMFYL